MKFLFFPDQSAEYTPGALSKISISIPESSDKQILLVFFEKYFAFNREFCVNVVPVSIGLGILKSNLNKSLNFWVIDLLFPSVFLYYLSQ